jgi:lipid-A-disaccharide synthase
MARIAMVAGEASSDQLAAHLIGALKQHLPDAEFYGIGGPKMQREGFESLWPAEMLAVRGYAEVLRHYRAITRMRRQLLRRLLKDPRTFLSASMAPTSTCGWRSASSAAGFRRSISSALRSGPGAGVA